MKKNSIPKPLVWAVIAICVLPTVFTLTGVDLGSAGEAIDPRSVSTLSAEQLNDRIFQFVSGPLTHTLLEWSAFSAAIFTVVLAFVHFRITGDVTTPVLGSALFCAGSMDAFHALAADRLIEAAADNREFIPFTWALSRVFNALVLTIGVTVCMFRRPTSRGGNLSFVLGISSSLGILSYVVIRFCAVSSHLPKTMFPDSVITRPWDVGPLCVYLLAAAVVFRPFHRRERSLFSHALLLSIIPQVATQLHMVFGSTALFDHHFNIAHFLKIIAYLVPFMGLVLEYVRAHQEQELAGRAVQEYANSLKAATERSERQAEVLERGNQDLARSNAEQKRAEEALSEERNLLRTLIDHLPDNIFFKDTEGRFVLCNRAQSDLLRVSGPDELAGKTESDFFSKELAEKYTADDQSVMRSGEPLINREEPVADENGNERWLLTTKVPLRDAAGKIIGLVGNARDITDLKRTQQELQRYLTELEEAKAVTERQAGDLRSQAEELSESNAELEKFAYVASHDLQEPLRMVAGYTQLLAKRYQGKLDTQADEFIAYAVDGATRMQRLINDLLAYSRVGRGSKEPEATDCEDVFRRALRNLGAAIEESGASVTNDPLPTVLADATQLGQLFQNLVGNSIKYRAAAAPDVKVSAQVQGNEWLFSVRDNGIGVEPQYQQRIFEVFQRLHTSDEHAGTGIGLAICKKIVERHNGRIWVESAPEQGSIFYFTLPKTDAPGE